MEQGFQEELIPLVDESVHEHIFGGYDFVFVDELSSGQTCSICLVAMRNPVQTPCGHRFCEECLLGTFRQGNGRVCPQDRNPIPETGGFFPDVAWQREILALRVKCKKNDRGCTWIGALRHYEGHFDLCLYEDVVCEDCEEEMQRRFLEDHMASECQNRIVQCEHCEEEFEFWRTEVHEGEECTRFPLECPQQCGVQEIPREEMASHVRDDCSMTLVVCPYQEAGCTFNDKRINLKAHLEESTEEHLYKSWKELIKTKGEIRRVNNEFEKHVEEMQGCVEQLQLEKDEMETSLQRKSEEITNLMLSDKKLEVENLSLKQEVTELTRHLGEIKENAATEIGSLKELVLTIQSRLEDMETTEDRKQVYVPYQGLRDERRGLASEVTKAEAHKDEACDNCTPICGDQEIPPKKFWYEKTLETRKTKQWTSAEPKTEQSTKRHTDSFKPPTCKRKEKSSYNKLPEFQK